MKNENQNQTETKLPNYRIYDETGGGVTEDIYAESLDAAIEQGREWIEGGDWSGCGDDEGGRKYRTIKLECSVREIVRECYYVDVYRSGCARDICGPYATLDAARDITSADTEDGETLSLDPYDGVVEELRAKYGAANVEMVEAWSAPCESDADTIYRVSGHAIDGAINDRATVNGDSHDCSGEYADALPDCEVGSKVDADKLPDANVDSEGHEWVSTTEMGKQFGCRSHGDTRMSHYEVCRLCGQYKTTVTPGCQRNPDEALETITIKDRDEASTAWLKETHEDDGWIPEWLCELLDCPPTVRMTEAQA